MSRAEADAYARETARKLVAEYDRWEASPATFPTSDPVLLGRWLGQAAATLGQLGIEPEPDDPPEVDPEDAEAQRIAEIYADAADEMRAAEAEGWRMP